MWKLHVIHDGTSAKKLISARYISSGCFVAFSTNKRAHLTSRLTSKSTVWQCLPWWFGLAPGRLFTFGTSREGAYSRESPYSGQSAYFFFEKNGSFWPSLDLEFDVCLWSGIVVCYTRPSCLRNVMVPRESLACRKDDREELDKEHNEYAVRTSLEARPWSW